jgi:hypothetical protein
MAANAQKITGLANGTAAQDAAAFGQLTRLLAVVQYAPGTPATATVTGATLTAFDTTNLTIPFTAPLSGNVLLRATCEMDNGTTGQIANLGWFLHGSSTVVGTIAVMKLQALSNNSVQVCKAWLITGLTPGASLQYDLMGANNTGGTVSIFASGPTAASSTDGGPAVLEVWSA